MTNLSGRIDVKKIVKEKLYVGEKGTYLDIVLIETPENQYDNDYMIVQKTGKDEPSIILGNAKVFKKKEADIQPEIQNYDENLPF